MVNAKEKNNLITLVMPIYNGSSTLNEVFFYLDEQYYKNLISKIFLINDNSSDDSLSILENYSKNSPYDCVVITNPKGKGLAENYNIGIKKSKSKYVILMHQDILLIDKKSFIKLTNPLMENSKFVASYPIVLHPRKIWSSYGFWQKAMFSRFLDKEVSMLTGKFDCFSVEFLSSINFFDSKTFRTAGEDGDMKIKIKKSQKYSSSTNLKVIHLHNKESNFGWKKYLRKEAQLAEAQGVILRKYGPQGVKVFLLSFFRTLLLFGLLIPYIRYLSLVLIILFCYLYTDNLFKNEKTNIKIFMLPFVNIFSLFVASYFSFRGFIFKKQTL